MKEAIVYAAMISMLIFMALEMRYMNQRITELTEIAHETRAMVTSMFSVGRVGQVVK